MVIQSDGKGFANNEEQESKPFAARDKIAVYFDGAANSVKFYINDEEAFTGSLERESNVNYVIAVAFSSSEPTALTTIALSGSVEPPEELDLLGR